MNLLQLSPETLYIPSKTVEQQLQNYEIINSEIQYSQFPVLKVEIEEANHVELTNC